MAPRNENDQLNEARIVEPATPMRPADQPQSSEASTVPTNPTPQAPKKRRSVLPVLLIVGVLALLGGAAAAYTYWYQNPERVVNQAMYNLVSSDSMQHTTKITSDSELLSGPMNLKLKEFAVNAAGSTSVAGDLDAKFALELNGRDYNVGAKARLTDDKTVYFQLIDVKDLMQKAVTDFVGSDAALSAEVLAQLDEIQNKWVKVTLDDMGEQSKAFSCSIDTMKKYAKDEEFQNEMVDMYRDNQFMNVKEKVDSKDGNLGYRVEINQDEFKAYAKANLSSKLSKELQKCDESADFDESDVDFDDMDQGDQPNVDLVMWVSRFGHKLQQVDYTVTAKNQSTNQDMVFKGETKLSYDTVTVEAPGETVDFKTWQAKVEKVGGSVQQDLMGGGAQASGPTAAALPRAVDL